MRRKLGLNYVELYDKIIIYTLYAICTAVTDGRGPFRGTEVLYMKKICIALLLPAICLTLGSCGGAPDKTIKIAVTGNPDAFPSCYADGIRMAESDLNEKYSDSGYKVECVFYGDNGSYEEGAAVTGSLAADESITAVIGSADMDINKTAAYAYGEAEKLFVMPFFLYDSVFEDNGYDMIFSMCASARSVGEKLRSAAAKTSAKRWAVCAASDEFSTAEMNGFIRYAPDSGISIVDCVNAKEFESSFDTIYKRWEALGVEGVIIFPGSMDGFAMFKKIKTRSPNMVCGGDTSFDNVRFISSNPDIMNMLPGFMMADAFAYDEVSADGDDFGDMAERYEADSGTKIDTWFLQGYNAVGMIAETAINAHTNDSAKIAELLHEDGYNGFCQEFKFNANGIQDMTKYQYSIYIENGNAPTVR